MNLRSTTLALGCIALFGASPAFAQAPMECDHASMVKANADIAKMPDATKRAAAMKEMEMAQKMSDSKDIKACVGHMNAATMMMK